MAQTARRGPTNDCATLRPRVSAAHAWVPIVVILADGDGEKPVMAHNYPLESRPFAMRRDANDKTMSAMDFLVWHMGELVGGSKREERLDRCARPIDMQRRLGRRLA